MREFRHKILNFQLNLTLMLNFASDLVHGKEEMMKIENVLYVQLIQNIPSQDTFQKAVDPPLGKLEPEKNRICRMLHKGGKGSSRRVKKEVP